MQVYKDLFPRGYSASICKPRFTSLRANNECKQNALAYAMDRYMLPVID